MIRPSAATVVHANLDLQINSIGVCVFLDLAVKIVKNLKVR